MGISPENPENLDFSENSNFFFSIFFGKIGQNPPGSLKLDPPSQDFQYEPNPSEFDRFRSTFSFFFEKFKKKWPKNETFFNFFPTPQPPGTLGPSFWAKAHHAGVVGQSFIPIGPNGASFMPIFRFKINSFSTTPPNTRLGTLGFTDRIKGNLLSLIFYEFLSRNRP